MQACLQALSIHRLVWTPTERILVLNLTPFHFFLSHRSPALLKLGSYQRNVHLHLTAHISLLHICSLLFLFFACLFLLFVSGSAHQEELPLLLPSCYDAEWCFNVLPCRQQTKAHKHYMRNIKLTHSYKNKFSPAVKTEVILGEVLHDIQLQRCTHLYSPVIRLRFWLLV